MHAFIVLNGTAFIIAMRSIGALQDDIGSPNTRHQIFYGFPLRDFLFLPALCNKKQQVCVSQHVHFLFCNTSTLSHCHVCIHQWRLHCFQTTSLTYASMSLFIRITNSRMNNNDKLSKLQAQVRIGGKGRFYE